MVITKNSLIFRDVLYVVLLAIVFWPGSKVDMALWMKLIIVVLAIGTRVWQHVVYYKATGKIY